MRLQVLFRQGTRVSHALERGRHDARRKRVAPDSNPLNPILTAQSFFLNFWTETHTAFSRSDALPLEFCHSLLTETQL